MYSDNNLNNNSLNQNNFNTVQSDNSSLQNNDNNSMKPEKKKNIGLFIAIGGIVCVVGVGAVLGSKLLNNKNDDLNQDDNIIENNGDSSENEDNNDDYNYDIITEEIVRNHKVTSESDFTYEERANGIAITGYIGDDTIVVIPEKIAGTPVVSLTVNSFGTDCTVRGVFVPSGVKELNGVFANNKNLEVVIWESAQVIGDNTFNSCTSLHTVIFGDKLTDIGENAFFYCTSLEELYIPASVKSLDSYISPTIFYYCDNLTIKGKKGSFIETFCKENGIPFEAQ